MLPINGTFGCRYGKQTFSGVIKDGMSAITRYYLNNFHDGVRQVSLSTSMKIQLNE